MKGVFMNHRKILIALAVQCKGNWEEIYNKLCLKEFPDEEYVEKVNSKIKCNVLTILDYMYPTYLRNEWRPPFVLFYYGDINLINEPKFCLGVVGTRNPSEFGVRTTQEMVSNLAKDYVIVSGMASGIDRNAHLAAINNNGKTIAIIGSGPDICWPSDNDDIYKIIKKDHLLISEYPPGTSPSPENFPQRNRLIVQFSLGILVVEGSLRSGSSITANIAANTNKDVFCVPSINLNDSVCNKYIKEGAVLVENAEDVRYYLARKYYYS